MTCPQPSDGFAWVQAPAGRRSCAVPLEPFARHLFTTRDWRARVRRAAIATTAWADVARGDRRRTDAARPPAAGPRRRPWSLRRRRSRAALRTARRRHRRQRRSARSALAIQTADCVPLLLADRRTRRGAPRRTRAGAGWPRACPQRAVAALRREFGSRAGRLDRGDRPVDRRVLLRSGRGRARAFARAGFAERDSLRWFIASRSQRRQSVDARASRARRPAHWFFDGWRRSRDQLAARGVPGSTGRIARSSARRATRTLFCSYRRDGEAPAGWPRPSDRRQSRVDLQLAGRVVHRRVGQAIGVRVTRGRRARRSRVRSRCARRARLRVQRLQAGVLHLVVAEHLLHQQQRIRAHVQRAQP